MGDRDYRSTRRTGRRVDQVDDGYDYEASSRRAALPQYPQRTQQYAGQQPGQYIAYETRDAGYRNTSQYPSVQDQRSDQRMPEPNYWSGSASVNTYPDQTAGYSQDLPDTRSGETREDPSRRHPSGRTGESRDVRQDVPLRSMDQHEDEDEIDLYMKSRDQQWILSRGIRDTGNRGPHFVGSEKVLSLGFDHNHIDFDNVKQFRTLGGRHWTFGSIRLDYTSDGREKQSDFQVFDSNNIGEYDVIFSTSRMDEPILERSPPMVLMTIGSKKKADRETRKKQERLFKQREQEAREEEEASKAARRKQRQQSTGDPRYTTQRTEPTYGGESSSRNQYQQTGSYEEEDWIQIPTTESGPSTQMRRDWEPTRNSSPNSGQPKIYGDHSSTYSAPQEDDTRPTSVYSSQDLGYYDQGQGYGQTQDYGQTQGYDQAQGYDQSQNYNQRKPSRKSKGYNPLIYGSSTYVEESDDPRYARQASQSQYTQGQALDPRVRQSQSYGYDNVNYGNWSSGRR